MSFEQLDDEVNKGLSGRNTGIPMGFNRLNKYVGIRKRMYFLIGGNTGSGKTSLLDNAFVLNPVDWYLKNRDNTPIKLKIIYRSMERSSVYKFAKWISRKIFLDKGVIIPVARMLGWVGRMDKDEHDLYLMYRDYIGELLEIVTIIDGPENPIGISINVGEYAKSHGTIEQVDEHNKIYIPNNENEIVIVAADTLNLLKVMREYPTKKAVIDKMSDDFRYMRDFYGYVIAAVSQFNRDISNPIRIKRGDVEPQLEDFKESGQTQDDADIVIALFDPIRYSVEDPSGYDLKRLRDDNGANYFRSLRLIKNSYGEDNIRIGLGFLGQIGMFKELPKKREMMPDDYEAVINKSFFQDAY